MKGRGVGERPSSNASGRSRVLEDHIFFFARFGDVALDPRVHNPALFSQVFKLMWGELNGGPVHAVDNMVARTPAEVAAAAARGSRTG